METLIPFTLFGSGIIFGIVLVLLFITLITLDLTSNGFGATLAVCVFVGLNHFWGTFDIWSIVSFWSVFLYLLIGFFFSVIRTYAKGRELAAVDEKYKTKEKQYFELKEHVFRWWFLWPICAINWICGRLLKDAFDFIYGKLNKFYEAIFND